MGITFERPTNRQAAHDQLDRFRKAVAIQKANGGKTELADAQINKWLDFLNKHREAGTLDDPLEL